MSDDPLNNVPTPPVIPTGQGVNPQILDAVYQTTNFVQAGSNVSGPGIAFQKVAQAASYAVQDATDYQRNIQSISMTAQGLIITMMIADETKIPIYTPVLALLQEMTTEAAANLGVVGTAASGVVSDFSSLS